MYFNNIAYRDLCCNDRGLVPLSSVALVTSGIFPRKSEIFVLDDVSLTADTSTGFSRVLGQTITVEPDIVKPFLTESQTIAFADRKSLRQNRGLILAIEVKTEHVLAGNIPKSLNEYPELQEYIISCRTYSKDEQDFENGIKQFMISKKMLEFISKPKHIISVHNQRCQSFYDKNGLYAFPVGMYGVAVDVESCGLSKNSLTAIFNSKLFSFLRELYCKENDADRYARFKSIAEFPIPSNINSNCLYQYLDKIVDYQYYLNKNDNNHNVANSSLIASALDDVMNMIIYEIYFPSYVSEIGLSVKYDFEECVLGQTNQLTDYEILDFYKWYNSSNNKIRQKVMLLDTRSPEFLYTIHSKYNQ